MDGIDFFRISTRDRDQGSPPRRSIDEVDIDISAPDWFREKVTAWKLLVAPKDDTDWRGMTLTLELGPDRSESIVMDIKFIPTD